MPSWLGEISNCLCRSCAVSASNLPKGDRLRAYLGAPVSAMYVAFIRTDQRSI